MKAKVTDLGVVIPKTFFNDVEEVEFEKESDRVIVTPVRDPDPILTLGTNPIVLGVADASEKLDRYLCGR